MKDLAFFLVLARRHWVWLGLGALFSALALLAGVGLLAVAGWFITAGAIAAAGLAAAVQITTANGALRGFAFGRAALRYAERLTTHEATFRILAGLRVWVFERAAPLAPAKLASFRTGDLLSRVTQDVDNLDGLYLRLTTPLATALVGLAAAGLVIAIFAPAAAGFVIGAFAVAAIGVPVIALRRAEAASRRAVLGAAETRAEASDLVLGIAELRAFQADGRARAALDEATRRWLVHQRRAAGATALSAAVLPAAAGLAAIGAIGLIAHAGAGAAAGALAALATLALFEAAPPLAVAAELYGKTAASAGRLRALERTQPAAPPPAPDAIDVAPATPDIVFRKVTFAYDPAASGRAALADLDLAIPHGRKIALVGRSGAGKSSIFHLLLRFWAPQAGELTFGGIAAEKLTPSAIRARIAYLGQRADLFATSVRENLAFAKPEAREEEMRMALERARAWEVVKALPLGLDTWIGEGGALVSGGQARRIALARAILRDAPVLLLDEPTEGLDRDTEAEVLAALLDYVGGAARTRTIIMATHRPALIALADEVVVLDQGRIVQRGAPASLRAVPGPFQTMFAR